MHKQEFNEAYGQLNANQRKAVDIIDGPLFVLAGPGTGKTQLLSTRVANILNKTDINPNNILCITFTDNAARNMRERLETIIGQSAYHVAIHTFHSLGSEIISNYQDYFSGRSLLQQTDELGVFQIMYEIFETLGHDNPLATKVGDQYISLKDTLSVVSWLKQNALSPEEFRQIIQTNQKLIEQVSSKLADTFVQTPTPKLLNLYNDLAELLLSQPGERQFGFANFAHQCGHELLQAIEKTNESGRYAPAITNWRNSWCVKDVNGKHVFKETGRNQSKLYALADVYEQLLQQMGQKGLYDFDDMIIETVHALEKHDDLKFTLQERYQYILVDEFQDTNKAQFRMLQALGDNPVYEGRPNIMVVGDDDQAIYSFQGADASNMVYFIEYFKPVVVTLTDSYRSAKKILEASYHLANNISDRLEATASIDTKQVASKAAYLDVNAKHQVFGSELTQYHWVSQKIAQLIKDGVEPKSIAVIAPRHRYLERLMPYLGEVQVPVSYERRENILESPIILQLTTMVDLLVALSDSKHDEVDLLLSRVLSYDFWDLDNDQLVSISLQAYDKNTHWLNVIKNSPDFKQAKVIVNWFIAIAKTISYEPLEYILDTLLGTRGLDKSKFESPMRKYYFEDPLAGNKTSDYLTLLGQLATLRQHLRSWKPTATIFTHDLSDFVALHNSSGLDIVDTNPHTQTTNAVQVMTAYKAKGLEFDCVFVINAQDEVWGPTARSKSFTISLPKNLPIAPPIDSDNDKLRLLFVALTRAKHTLFITSYTHSYTNQLSPGLSFIGGNQADSKPMHALFKPNFVDTSNTIELIDIMQTDWLYRFKQIMADTPTLFEPILKKYKLSVTHLNNFTNIADAGPQYFLVHNLLRFPEAPTPAAAYGDAIHKTLQWIHTELRTVKLPSVQSAQKFFLDILLRKHLRQTDEKRLSERGKAALALYLKQRGKLLNTNDLVERGFNNEGSTVGEAKLTGKIDKMHIEGTDINVIDFKTGKPAKNWQGKDEYEKIKLHKYRQQLLFYKLLVENSATFSSKHNVSLGGLEFVEADQTGQLVDNLIIRFEEDELNNFALLIQAVWKHIIELNFPDSSKYPKTLAGIQSFEKDLIRTIQKAPQ